MRRSPWRDLNEDYGSSDQKGAFVDYVVAFVACKILILESLASSFRNTGRCGAAKCGVSPSTILFAQTFCIENKITPDVPKLKVSSPK